MALLLLFIASPAHAADNNYYQLLVNKQYALGWDYQPQNLVDLHDYIRANPGVKMTEQAALALKQMVHAMNRDGISDIYGLSGYRSYATQNALYNNKINYYRAQGYGWDRARQLAGRSVAPPGASEHQTGMTIDLATSENNGGLAAGFGNTKAGKWLATNSWRYGFILRYAGDKTDTTGYIYEPWHFRYVGEPHAEYMYYHNLCLEEYIELLQEEKLLTFPTADGIIFAVYYNEYNNSAYLPGTVLNVSAAYAGLGGCIITTHPPDMPLFDLSGHWCEWEVRSLQELRLVNGYNDNTFRPNKSINRAELMILIDRLYYLINIDNMSEAADVANTVEYTMTFADIDSTLYFYKALLDNSRRGLLPAEMLRKEDDLVFFDPQKAVLRREAALALMPLLGSLPDAPIGSLMLNDLLSEDEQLRQAVNTLTAYGVIQGDDKGNFNPAAALSRGEVSAMIARIVHILAPQKETAAKAPEERSFSGL